MQTIAKITPADYPDLLAAVDAGTTQRELARRYDCVPSLIARHVARARRSREPGEPVHERDPGVTAEPHAGSMRELLEARIRDPKTSARDLASLTNALDRLPDEEQQSCHPSLQHFRLGTLPRAGPRGPGRRRYRLMMRMPGRIDHVSGTGYDLTAADVLHLFVCALGSELGLTREDILGALATPAQ